MKIMRMAIFYNYLELEYTEFSDSLVFHCERSKVVKNDAKFKIIAYFLIGSQNEGISFQKENLCPWAFEVKGIIRQNSQILQSGMRNFSYLFLEI